MARLSELETYVPRLRRYARGLAGRTGVADDLVQDAILSALRSKGMGRGEALLHRLFAIITDFNRLRLSDLNGHDDYVTDLRGAVVAMRRSGGAQAAGSLPRLPHLPHDPLAVLSIEEREALLLVAVEDLSYEAAAGIAGISPLALVARLASARSRLEAPAAVEPAVLRATGHRHLRVVS